MKNLVIDVGGGCLSVLVTGHKQQIEFTFDPKKTPAKMVVAVRIGTAD